MDNIVRLDGVGASQALDYKNELLNSGLLLDVDFQWIWYAPALNDKAMVEFIFKNASYATFYKLKWE